MVNNLVNYYSNKNKYKGNTPSYFKEVNKIIKKTNATPDRLAKFNAKNKELPLLKTPLLEGKFSSFIKTATKDLIREIAENKNITLRKDGGIQVWTTEEIEKINKRNKFKGKKHVRK